MAESSDGGAEVYAVDANPVRARGVLYDAVTLDLLLLERVHDLVSDTSGRAEVAAILADLPATDFEAARLAALLDEPPIVEWWQICEAIAEAFLVDHRSCEFPWPFGRDLRNRAASPAGADLVGFCIDTRSARFAFGEVKASDDPDAPPSVMTGRSGLIAQLEKLRDDQPTKHQLVLYLGHRAVGAVWQPRYRDATSRFLADPNDVALFGILVRDTPPNELDLKNRAAALAGGCSEATGIELRAKYMPPGLLRILVERLDEILEDAVARN